MAAMAESTSRIEPVPSRPEPEAQIPQGGTKLKVRPKAKPKLLVEPAGGVEPDEEEKHDLDTLA
jgi:hypothetical protein